MLRGLLVHANAAGSKTISSVFIALLLSSHVLLGLGYLERGFVQAVFSLSS